MIVRVAELHEGDPKRSARSQAGKKYYVAGWAPLAEGASGQPVWEIVTPYLRSDKVIRPPRLNLTRLTGVSGNPGMS